MESRAKKALLAAINQLDDIGPNVNMNLPVTLHAITPDIQAFQSTFGRGLWFSNLHCVHHWTMIRLLAEELNVKLSETILALGFAPAKLVYPDRNTSQRKVKAKL